MNKLTHQNDCCNQDSVCSNQAFTSGLMFGVIPHLGCIGFVVAAIFGSTAIMTQFRPLLLHSNLFYILVGLSFSFATLSAIVFLKMNRLLHFTGIKKKWRYLSVLYASAILVNSLLFLVIFPYSANAVGRKDKFNNILEQQSSQSILNIKVNIPCSGHALLVMEELDKTDGINSAEFKFPDSFLVRYNPKRISEERILSLEIFNKFQASNL